MSIYSANTSATSILKKKFSGGQGREKAKNSILSKVRFDLRINTSLKDIIKDVLDNNNYIMHDEFIAYLKDMDYITDEDLLKIVTEARQSITLLDHKQFSNLIDAIISINWIERINNKKLIVAYEDLYLTLIVVHTEYAFNCIKNLILKWIPNDKNKNDWIKYIPNVQLKERLSIVHKIINEIITIVPLSSEILIDFIEKLFPYYKKPTFIISGYLHNCLWLLDYKPIFTEFIFDLIFSKLIYLDVNAPRDKIEEYEDDDEQQQQNGIKNEANDEENLNGQIFKMDECNPEENETMSYQIAETLDVFMEKIFNYFDKFKIMDNIEIVKNFRIIYKCFDNVILPAYNTHHSQFVMFYFCSFKPFLVERFLNNLWNGARNPNVPPPIRQSSISYIASFLARAKFISLTLLKSYLSEMCNWAHQYIQNSDIINTKNSLKVNIVFYSMCQAIFYVISFRNKDLTADKQDLLFLQSLQLQTLVTCNFNPLKVCLSAVATAFAGVTRQYQLAYCHAILERNARRKLATFYGNEIIMPEECLDTFFPFDPYILKKSGKRIDPIYLKYHANDSTEDVMKDDDDDDDDDEYVDADNSKSSSNRTIKRNRNNDNFDDCNTSHNKNNNVVGAMTTNTDDIDDFIIDKKPKLSSGHDKELQFNIYGSSPGFSDI